MQLIDSDCSHDLFDPMFEWQAGRLFLVGTIPEGATDSGWDENQVGAVVWEQVRNYVLFDDLASYKKAVDISEAFQSEA